MQTSSGYYKTNMIFVRITDSYSAAQPNRLYGPESQNLKFIIAKRAVLIIDVKGGATRIS